MDVATSIWVDFYNSVDADQHTSMQSKRGGGKEYPLPSTPGRKEALAASKALLRSLKRACPTQGAIDLCGDTAAVHFFASLLAFLSDWANPEDLGFQGLGKIVGLAEEAVGTNPPKSRLELLYLEIEQGYLVVPAALSSEAGEIISLHKNGFLSDDELKAFARFPSLDAYEEARAKAAARKREGVNFAGNASFAVESMPPTSCGERRMGLKKWSAYMRNSDYYAPGYMKKEDGSYGLAPEDDAALGLYRSFEKKRPNRPLVAACKMLVEPLALLNDDGLESYYTKDEEAIVEVLRMDDGAARGACDLFSALAIDALGASILDLSTPSSARAEYHALLRVQRERRAA